MNIRRYFVCLTALTFMTLAGRSFAMQADQIALIVNSNEPAGRELAELYARLRHVPDDRILELSLPTGDDISFNDFETIVVPQVRDFLRSGNLETKVKCLVTCYGIPLRMDGRVNTAEESRELDLLRAQIQPAVHDLQKPVADFEALAIRLTPNFQPAGGMDFDVLVGRADRAIKSVNGVLASMPDAQQRADLMSQVYKLSAPLVGRVADLQHRLLEQQLHPSTQPAVMTNLLADRERFNRDNQLAGDLERKRYDAHARARLREVVKAQFGAINYVRVLRDQADYLNPQDTAAAFDSELAMVQVPVYSHVRWRPNPYYYPVAAKSAGNVLMVSRLDGPTPTATKLLIEQSIKTETEGLKGKVVVDSRGMVAGRVPAGQASFAIWDQYFRNFAHLVRTKTNLAVTSDDTPDSMPAHAADGVAIYVGWYQLHNYTPVCTFNPGAIGMHLASFECLSIHSPTETGWVHGLLKDGVIGTVGPVAEPFLQSFPRPDDFFTLMLTGQFTLGEAYWRTTPMTSWMQTLVGDPLYNPYKTDPALKTTDLPDRLKAVTPP